MVISNKKKIYLINEEINFPEILLITVKDNKEEKEKMSIESALKKSKDEDLDLVCVSTKLPLPVCRLMNSDKYFFDESKKNKKKAKKSYVKEIKFRMSTNERDLLMKIDKIRSWINLGGVSMVKIILNLNRREVEHSNVSREKLDKMIETISNNIPNIELKKDNKIIKNSRNLCFYIQRKKNI